jgi:pyruvate dehydrogenase E1 component alpha subunit
MHLFDPERNFSCSGIEGASLPPATGAALAYRKLGHDSVAVAFFGEGAANQGTFHEALNLAGLWNLPAVFICEDNRWAISVPKEKSTAIASNADRAASYGMAGVSVDHNDAVEVFAAAGEAIARARRGGGPTLIEVQTDRYLGHFQGDAEVYRPKGEPDELRGHDPIPKLAEAMREQGVLDDARDDKIRSRAAQRVTAAYEFARESPLPDPAEALEHVFV